MPGWHQGTATVTSEFRNNGRMATVDLPHAEYDKPGWLVHLALVLLVLAPGVWRPFELDRDRNR